MKSNANSTRNNASEKKASKAAFITTTAPTTAADANYNNNYGLLNIKNW